MKNMETIHSGGELGAVNAATRSHVDELNTVLLRCLPAFRRMAFRKVGNAEDAEDAVQDALLSAFKHLHQFRGQSRLSTWLASIVLNSARMQLRRRLNNIAVSLDENREGSVWADTLEHSGPDAEEVLRRVEARETLEQLVEKLPTRLRTAFYLCVFEGLSTCEAAALLRVSQGTLKAQLFRARKRVTNSMRELSVRDAKLEVTLTANCRKRPATSMQSGTQLALVRPRREAR